MDTGICEDATDVDVREISRLTSGVLRTTFGPLGTSSGAPLEIDSGMSAPTSNEVRSGIFGPATFDDDGVPEELRLDLLPPPDDVATFLPEFSFDTGASVFAARSLLAAAARVPTVVDAPAGDR